MISLDRLRQVLKTVGRVKLGVVGDLYLDRYSTGVMEAISREAPIPIVRLKSRNATVYTPGAAGNVAMNMAALGANVAVIGVIGEDLFGQRTLEALDGAGVTTAGIVRCNDRMTGAFEKFYATAYHSRVQQVARIDTESSKPISRTTELAIRERMADLFSGVDALVVADYAEIPGTGVVTDSMIGALRSLLPEKIIVADSRLRIGLFREMILVPNDYEAAMAAGLYESHSSGTIGIETTMKVGSVLVEKCKGDLYITVGDRGIIYFDSRGGSWHIPTVPLDGEIDPTGAGDTVAAVVAASLAAGATGIEAGEIANLAARVTVGKIGTTGTPTPGEILACHDIVTRKQSFC